MKMKKVLSLILCAIMMLTAFSACGGDKTSDKKETDGTTETTAPVIDNTPKFIYKHVVIIGVDGMGAFCKEADTPNMDRIFKDGATTYVARTAVPSISAQCWGSLLTGSSAFVHGLNNSIVESKPYTNSDLPTIFKRVRDAMPDAALASYCHWSPVNKGIIEDDIGVVKVNGEDSVIHEQIAEYLKENDPTLFYAHFDSPDGAGHENGYGSEEHLAQITTVDGYIGKVYDALVDAGKLEDTLFIVATDHGGTTGGSHGGYTDAEMNVFFGAVGKTVKKGSTIGEMNIRDIAAIALYGLGLDIPEFNIDGFSAQIPDGLFEGYTVVDRKPIYASDNDFKTLSTPAKDSGKFITDFIDADKVSSVFHFDNNVKDEMGNTTAEVQYSPKYYSAGYFDNCIEVGAQGAVLLPDAISSEDSYAISLWFQHDLSSFADVVLYGSHSVAVTNNLGMSAKYNATNITLSIGNGNSTHSLEVTLSETMPKGWNNLTVVYDRDTQTISCYINFKFARSTNYSKRFTTTDFANSKYLVFGNDPSEYNDVNIMLDELVIFNSALTAEEVGKLAEYYSFK